MTTISSEVLRSYRCNCGKLLFKGLLLGSTIQIKCKKCGELVAFQGLEDQAVLDNRYAFLLNDRGDIVSASSNIQKLFGYSVSDLLAMSHDTLSPTTVSEDSLRASLAQMWSLRHKERYYFRSRTTYRHKDGRFVSGIAQAKFIATPEGTYLYSVFHANATFADAPVEAEFLQLQEYPFFVQVDRDGMCTYASSARKQPYSPSYDEIIGKSYASFLQESAATRQEFLQQLKRNKPFELLGKRYRHKDRPTIRLDVYFAPNFDESGTVIDYSVYAFNHDMLTDYESTFRK